MQKLATLHVFVLAVAAIASQGCLGRLLGEGAEGTLGPKGAYFEEKPVAANKDTKPLSAYGQFELGEVSNVYGKNVPSEFMAEFPTQFAERLKGSDLAKGAGEKTLVFNVQIIHYETADMEDNVFGPLEEVIARVELVDKESGTVIASGNAVGRTGKTVGLGTKTKAEGLAKALVKWAEDYHEKPS
jgi:hypothetical protein